MFQTTLRCVQYKKQVKDFDGYIYVQYLNHSMSKNKCFSEPQELWKYSCIKSACLEFITVGFMNDSYIYKYTLTFLQPFNIQF